MKAADVAIIAMAALSLPVWAYGVRQQLSSMPGSSARVLKSGCLYIAIIMIGMFAAYLLG